MLSIHSSVNIFRVLVSIFILQEVCLGDRVVYSLKALSFSGHHLSAINTFSLLRGIKDWVNEDAYYGSIRKFDLVLRK